ncbi:MAG: SDR family NAD(P)-dependent oxidoreductase [Bacillota bacterium]|nr:SDR family NAD(P)-dependent oxidoreductase [Bacillota bacterium]
MKRTILLTGATSGLGLATALALASKPYNLILTWRDQDKADQLRQRLDDSHPKANISLIELDLASFASIEACCTTIQKNIPSIDVLFNNAGLYMDTRGKTAEGFEMTLGVNYIGPAYLTWLLLPLLRLGDQPQILQMCSRAALFGWFRDKPDLFERHPHGFRAYAASKRMQLMLTISLADTLKADGVTVNAIHPGVVATSIWRGESLLMRLLDRNKHKRYLSAAAAANAGLFLIENATMRQVTGRFFENEGQEIKLSRRLTDRQRIASLVERTKEAIRQKGGQPV